MSEKLKRDKGLLYDANFDKELLDEMTYTRSLIFKYNNINPANKEELEATIKQFKIKTKQSFTIRQPFYCDYGYNISIGENFFSNFNLTILDGAKVTIGDNVFIAPNVGIYTAGHPVDYQERNKGLEYAYPVTIGDNVWIGASVVILPGVTIGNNSIIGAGSIVTKNIPDNVIAIGNPCKVVRKIS